MLLPSSPAKSSSNALMSLPCVSLSLLDSSFSTSTSSGVMSSISRTFCSLRIFLRSAMNFCITASFLAVSSFSSSIFLNSSLLPAFSITSSAERFVAFPLGESIPPSRGFVARDAIRLKSAPFHSPVSSNIFIASSRSSTRLADFLDSSSAAEIESLILADESGVRPEDSFAPERLVAGFSLLSSLLPIAPLSRTMSSVSVGKNSPSLANLVSWLSVILIRGRLSTPAWNSSAASSMSLIRASGDFLVITSATAGSSESLDISFITSFGLSPARTRLTSSNVMFALVALTTFLCSRVWGIPRTSLPEVGSDAGTTEVLYGAFFFEPGLWSGSKSSGCGRPEMFSPLLASSSSSDFSVALIQPWKPFASLAKSGSRSFEYNAALRLISSSTVILSFSLLDFAPVLGSRGSGLMSASAG